MTPRLRAEEERGIVKPENETRVEATLALCCTVPIRRSTVFEGLRDRKLEASQVWTESRQEDRDAKAR